MTHHPYYICRWAYCYRPSSMVWRSITVVTLQNAEPIEMFGLTTLVGPRNHVLNSGPEVLRDVDMATNFGMQFAVTGLKGQFWGRKGASHCIGTHCSHLHKNGWNDRDAAWVMGSDEPKESCVRWGSRGAERRCHGNQFWDAICYNWLCVNDVEGFEWSANKMQILPIPCN